MSSQRSDSCYLLPSPIFLSAVNVKFANMAEESIKGKENRNARATRWLDRALPEWMSYCGRHVGVSMLMILGSSAMISERLCETRENPFVSSIWRQRLLQC